MVLPTPAADAVAAPPLAPWLTRLTRLLELAPASVLILVEAPDHASIGALIRTVGDSFGHIHVVTDVRELLSVPEGSLVALCPRTPDATWLNLKRPWIADRSLRLLIWADHELAGVLHEQAPDFYDWISHHQHCPPTPVGFALAGLRAAADAPGICWYGEPDAFIALLQQHDADAKLHTISAESSYEQVLTEIRGASDAWLLFTDVHGPFRVRRLRWALAECDRSARAVFLGRQPFSPGWHPLHARRASLFEMTPDLARLELTEPARAAVLGGLEPDLINLLEFARSAGVPPASLAACFDEPDPGAAIAAKLWHLPLAVVGDAPGLPPLFRHAEPGLSDRSVQRRDREVRAHLRRDLAVDTDVLAGVTARARWSSPLPSPRSTPLVRGWLLEALLRGRRSTSSDWLTYAQVADALGDHEAQLHWLQRALSSPSANEVAAGDPYLEQVFVALRKLGNSQATESILAIARQLLTTTDDEASDLFLLELADILTDRGRLASAEELVQRVLDRTAGAGERRSLRRDALEQLLDLREELGKPTASLEQELNNLPTSDLEEDGAGFTITADATRADPEPETLEQLRATITRLGTSLGEEHPAVIGRLLTLAESLQAAGQRAEALQVLATAMERLDTGLSPDTDLTVAVVSATLDALHAEHQIETADQIFRIAAARLAALAGREHPAYIELLEHYASLLLADDRTAQAEPLLRELLTIGKEAHGSASETLAELLADERRWDEAEAVLVDTRAAVQRAEIHDDEFDVESSLVFAAVCRAQGRHAEAESVLERALRDLRRWPRDEWRDQHLELVTALGDLLMGLARYADALNLYRTAIADDPALTSELQPLANRAATATRP
jgi:tetratricopeptide (TPR) repeat protein